MLKKNRTTTITRIVALVAAATMLAGAAPASAAQNSGVAARAAFVTRLRTEAPAAKFQTATQATAALTAPAAKSAAPVKALVASTAVKATGTTSVATKRTAGTEQAQAKAILAGLVAKYPILQGTTVTFGDARGYQAIALYKSGRIIINPNHTTSLSRILNHEVWHVIDWRDNGRIDWNENIPPR